MHSGLKYVPVSELAEVNPPTNRGNLLPHSRVSFIPMADVSEEGEWVSHQTRRLQEVEQGYTSFRENDILFAKITPCTENGKGAHAISLVNGIGFGSTEFHVLRPKHPDSGRYLFHWSQFETLRLKAASVMIGSAGQQRVPVWFFDEFTIPIFSLPEQRRIGEILDTADEAIRQTERLIAKLKLIKAGLLHDLLTRGLDDHGQLRDPQAYPEQFKDSPLGKIPKEWEICILEDLVASAVDGPFGSNLKTEHYVSTPGVRVVRLQNIGSGYFDDTDKAYISNAHAHALLRHEVAAGDLLIASLGDDNHPIARACLYPADASPGIVKADCFRFRLKHSLAVHAYVMHVFNCTSTRGDINALGHGVTRDRVTLTTIQRVRIRVPPVEEQTRLGAAIEAHDARIRAEEAAMEKLRQVKRGLMDDLLAGKVRVNR
jgi:type I restriction enzyme S subunit